jgi:hypothetical protein
LNAITASPIVLPIPPAAVDVLVKAMSFSFDGFNY